MKDINFKYIFASILVAACYAGSFEMDRTRMFLPYLWWYVRRDMDSDYAALRLPDSTLVFGWQVLKKDSNIVGNDDAQQASFIFDV